MKLKDWRIRIIVIWWGWKISSFSIFFPSSVPIWMYEKHYIWLVDIIYFHYFYWKCGTKPLIYKFYHNWLNAKFLLSLLLLFFLNWMLKSRRQAFRIILIIKKKMHYNNFVILVYCGVPCILKKKVSNKPIVVFSTNFSSLGQYKLDAFNIGSNFTKIQN